MPCDLGSVIGGISTIAFESKFLNKTMGSVFWTALLISVVIIFVVMVMLPLKKQTTIFKIFRTLFYIFATTGLILILHDGVIRSTYENIYQKSSSDDMVKKITDNNRRAFGGDDIIKVKIPDHIAVDNRDVFEKLGV